MDRFSIKQHDVQGWLCRFIGGMFCLWVLSFLNVAYAAESSRSYSEEETQKAVQTARNAFEYRDFALVIRTLEPYVHPPRIAKPELLTQARELLGISYTLTDNKDKATQEFSALLLMNPSHSLDPFTVPPQVIETFEDVRRDMKQVLEVESRPQSRPIDVTPPPPDPDGIVMLLPFGYPQFVKGKPALGGMVLTLHVLALGANVLGYMKADHAPDPALAPLDGRYRGWVTVQYVGLGALLVSWAASIIHAQTVED